MAEPVRVIRWWAWIGMLCLWVGGVSSVEAAESRSFQWQGVRVSVEDQSAAVEVLYQSMRLNRATGNWEFELKLRNTSQQTLRPPFVVSMESLSGSAGLVRPDGTDEAGRPFFDVSPQVARGSLGVGEVSAARTIALKRTGETAPRVVFRPFSRAAAGAYALALVRTTESSGVPLRGVTVVETGPQGARTRESDPVFGMVTLGQGGGEHRWRFEKTGFHPVWRRGILTEGGVADTVSPRLTEMVEGGEDIGPTGGSVASADGTVRMRAGAGVFSEASTVRVIAFESQSVPAELPLGWSPLSVFAVETVREPTVAMTGVVTMSGPLGLGESAVLARWDESRWEWVVSALVVGRGGSGVEVPVSGAGVFVIAVADVGSGAPGLPVVGASLPVGSAALPLPGELTAGGRVTPSTSLASTVAQLVTGQAELYVTNSVGPIPSGTKVRGVVTEEYRMVDGTVRRPARYENVITVYRRPGSGGERVGGARFGMRPLRLLSSDELMEAIVRMDVTEPRSISSGVIEVGGGEVSVEGVRVVAGAGDLDNAQAVIVRRLSAADFVGLKPMGGEVVGAFELMIHGVVPGRGLSVWFEAQRASSRFVLARVMERDGMYGLEPVRRYTSDAQGVLVDGEPVEGERFGGVRGAGQYVLVALDIEHALVSGVVRGPDNRLLSGVISRTRDSSWLGLTGEDGRFRTLAPRGGAVIAFRNAATGDAAQIAVEVPSGGPVSMADTTVGPHGPEMVTASPQDGAVNVVRVSPVTVEFSQPINPGSLGLNGVELVDAAGSVVAASVTLNLRNTVVSLLPTSPLAASTRHTVRLSSGIKDGMGRALEGVREFSFTTAGDGLNRQSAQLISHEPEGGKARLVGTAGVAEAGVPVILANETTGRTATVVSKPDGSFDNFVEADADDVLSATVQNRNGTRTRVPVGRQLFRDGSVALFRGGGILEAQSDGGPVQVIVEPGSVPNKTKFRLEPVGMVELMNLLSNTPPKDAALLGGLRISMSGDTPTVSPEVSFARKLEDLGLPAGMDPKDASFLLTIPRQEDGTTVYQVVDHMEYHNGTVSTHSLPFLGFVAAAAGSVVNSYGGISSVLVAPLIITFTSTVTIIGRVQAAHLSEQQDRTGYPIPLGTPTNLAGAVVAMDQHFDPSLERRGRLAPGSLMSVTGPDGKYTFVLQVNRLAPPPSVLLRARHASFPGLPSNRTVQLAGVFETFLAGNAYEANIYFPIEDAQDQGPPVISTSVAPLYPKAREAATLHIVATDDFSKPTLRVELDSVRATSVQGELLPADVVTLTETPSSNVGAHTAQSDVRVVCEELARVVLKVTATDRGGHESHTTLAIDFGATPPPATTEALTDVNDRLGPAVIYSQPAEESISVNPLAPLTLRFNAALAADMVRTNRSWFYLTPDAGTASVDLSEDGKEVSMRFPGMQSGSAYTLTVLPLLPDRGGNSFDQDPSTPQLDLYDLHFRTSVLVTNEISGVDAGAGVLVKGRYGYLLEQQGSKDGSLQVYEFGVGTAPVKVGELSVPGFPRDLVLIPRYPFIRKVGSAPERKDLVLVVGGRSGGGGQYLWVIDVSKPTNPERLASVLVSVSPASVVGRVGWDPPYVTYLENGDSDTIGYVKLQTLILGDQLTPEEVALLEPVDGTVGVDANGDGDFVDDGDVLPIPARRGLGFFGLEALFTQTETTQPILDYSSVGGGEYLGVTLGSGVENPIPGSGGGAAGAPVKPSYRTLVRSGVGMKDWKLANFELPGSPKRLLILPRTRIGAGKEAKLVDLALVSVRGEGLGTNNMVVALDITDPLAPSIAGFTTLTNSAAIPQSAKLRDDGLVALATSIDVILLRLDELGGAEASLKENTRWIAGSVPGVGTSMKAFGSDPAGLNLVSLGGRNRLVRSAPSLSFVSFPLIAPSSPENWYREAEVEILERLSAMVSLRDLPYSRYEPKGGAISTINPPSSATHFHVLLEAPGLAGPTVDLTLEALNRAGHPLPEKGKQFPPVRAGSLTLKEQERRSDCMPEMRYCKAYRLSDDPTSALYNKYLSVPIALVGEAIGAAKLEIEYQRLDRVILWSGHFVRASIDPSMVASRNSILAPYASVFDGNQERVLPGVAVEARAIPGDYIMGPNPPPLRGGVVAPDAAGMLGAHNGEFSASIPDLFVRGRKLNLEFVRTLCGQANYEGAFGVGWDFNYNQRLVELRGENLRDNSIPLVFRGVGRSNETALPGDVIFHTGTGRSMVFRFVGTNTPPEVIQDPLVAELGWIPKVDRFYLPSPGSFDLLFKFKDRSFVRLQPDGAQYWHGEDGRLERIYDRFPKSWIELTYTRRGELSRLQLDNGNFIEIGYWRAERDSLFERSLDLATTEPFVFGKIARLRDYSGRELTYHYTTQGLLERREGIQVGAEVPVEPRGYQGILVSRYLPTSTCGEKSKERTTLGIVDVHGTGEPAFAMDQLGTEDEPVAKVSKIGTKQVKLSLSHANTSEGVGSQGSSVVEGLDGTKTAYSFDDHGRPLTTTITGTNTVLQTAFTYTSDGLVKKVVYPEGNSVEYIYDVANPSIRARGNLMSITKRAGPRGGPDLEASNLVWDNRYNLPKRKTDFNGNTFVLTLRPDGREALSIGMESGEGSDEGFVFNDYGQLESHTATAGVKTDYTFYEETGYIKTKTTGPSQVKYFYAGKAGERGLATRIEDPMGFVSTQQYDERNLLVRRERAGEVLRFAYDEFGHTVWQSSLKDTGVELIEERSYDRFGFQTNKVLKGIQVDGVERDLVTTYEPDSQRRVSRVVFPGGEQHVVAYDGAGRVTSYTAGTHRMEFLHDGNGNVVEERVGNAVTRKIYDGYDRLIQLISPERGIVGMSYDGNDNLLSMTNLARNGTTVLTEAHYVVDTRNRYKRVTQKGDSEDRVTHYAYDDAARKMTMTDAMGQTSETTFDAVGRIQFIRTGSVDTEYGYDRNGNLTRTTVTEREGPEAKQYVLEQTFDGGDRLVLTKDGSGRTNVITPSVGGWVLSEDLGENNVVHNTYTKLGELLSVTDGEGVEQRYTYNANRDVSSLRDGNGNEIRHFYDTGGRLVRTVYPNSEETIYSDHNALSSPQRIQYADSTVEMSYDLESRLKARTIRSENGVHEESYQYDEMGRTVEARHQHGVTHLVYDKLGYTKKFTYEQNNLTHELTQKANLGGFRETLVYPSGVEITSERDLTGRLKGVKTGSGSDGIVSGTEYFADDLVGRRVYGTNLVMLARFDALKRPVGIRYERRSDGARLIEARYKYDSLSRQTARQRLDMGARMDLFAYDKAGRLTRADVLARPRFTGDVTVALDGFQQPEGLDVTSGHYAKVMAYNQVDLLRRVTVSRAEGVVVPPTVRVYGAEDSILFVKQLDDVVRLPDRTGNVVRTLLWPRLPGVVEPVGVMANLAYDGLGRLIRIEREDGVTIQYHYSTAGLVNYRKVTGPSERCEAVEQDLVYDGGNLIEVRDLLDNSRVTSRFYYGDHGDELFAADFINPSGEVRRRYYAVDALGSVLALVDEQGRVTERYSYDPWGQGVIEGVDQEPPQIRRVTSNGRGFVLEFSEAILPTAPETDLGSGLVTASRPLAGLIKVRSGGALVSGSLEYREDLPGFARGTTIRFEPLSEVSTFSVEIVPGGLVDGSGNWVEGRTVEFAHSSNPGSVLFEGSQASTAPGRLARAEYGSPFGFQSQYFDADAGLYYVRARFYDPWSAMFLQADPAGGANSPNLYAGFANDPVNRRDPTGRLTMDSLLPLARFAVGPIGQELKDMGKNARLGDGPLEYSRGLAFLFVGAALDLGTGLAQGLELANQPRVGPAGLIDSITAASLVTGDVAMAATLAGSLWGAAKFGVNAGWNRIQNYAPSGATYAKDRARLFAARKSAVEIEKVTHAIMQRDGIEYNQAKAIARVVHKENIELSIRVKADNPLGNNLTRMKVARGMTTKPFGVDNKSANGVVVSKKTRKSYTADLDIWDIKDATTGERLSSRRMAKIGKMINEEYTAISGKKNVPIQHNAQIQMTMDQGGIAYGFTGDSECPGKRLTDHLMEVVGHPGHTITIRPDRAGNIIAYRTPGWSTDVTISIEHFSLSRRNVAGMLELGLPDTWHQWK